MSLIFSILILVVCALLILIVLVQNSKGGGLSSTFASSNQVMGVRKTADFLEKSTWVLAAALIVLCLASTASTMTPEDSSRETISTRKAEEGGTAAPAPAAKPAPTPAPAPAPSAPAQ